MKNKELTFEELRELALKHYAQGGDGVYECWGPQEFEDYVAEFGPITVEVALKMFGVWQSVWNDMINC